MMKNGVIWGFLGVGTLAAIVVGLLLPGEEVGAEIGARLPEYSAETLEGGEAIAFTDLEGQVALVTIWATWCGPCRVEMPSIQAVYDRYKDEGFTVLAISIDTDPNYKVKIQEFMQDFGLTFPMIVDPANRITRVLNTIGVPENFIVDRNGRVVKRVVGASNWNSEANRALIEELLRM